MPVCHNKIIIIDVALNRAFASPFIMAILLAEQARWKNEKKREMKVS